MKFPKAWSNSVKQYLKHESFPQSTLHLCNRKPIYIVPHTATLVFQKLNKLSVLLENIGSTLKKIQII